MKPSSLGHTRMLRLGIKMDGGFKAERASVSGAHRRCRA